MPTGRQRAWALYPCFRDLCCRDGPTIGDTDVQELRFFRPDRNDLFGRHVAWCIDSVLPRRVPVVFTHRGFMYRLMARFFEAENEFAAPDPSLSVSIYHLRPDPLSCSPADAAVYYYIHVYDWIARHAELHDVVALLDAIQANFLAVQEAQQRRRDAYRLLNHFDFVLRGAPDPIRHRYVRNKIERVLREHECEVLALKKKNSPYSHHPESAIPCPSL